jgi:hypothetical protein
MIGRACSARTRGLRAAPCARQAGRAAERQRERHCEVHRLKCRSLRLRDADRHSRLRHNGAYTGDKGGIAVGARRFQQIRYFHPEPVNVRIAGRKPHDRLAEA